MHEVSSPPNAVRRASCMAVVAAGITPPDAAAGACSPTSSAAVRTGGPNLGMSAAAAGACSPASSAAVQARCRCAPSALPWEARGIGATPSHCRGRNREGPAGKGRRQGESVAV